MRQVILDTETTGLKLEDGHRVIEIGCVELINRQLTGRHYHQYINPERSVEQGALNVHGITSEFLSDKPLFSQIAPDFLNFLKEAELIIHNASFDVGFLNHELQRAYYAHYKLDAEHTVIDTLRMARELHIGQRNNLDALCKRYGVDVSNRQLHGALLDANLLAHVYLAMTGGQTQLFEREDQPAVHRLKKMRRKIKRQAGALPVIFADTHELEAHHAYLERLKSE